MGRPKNFQGGFHSSMGTGWRISIDDKVTCPYDRRHVMPYQRMLLHIAPCAQKHPELGHFVTCPYTTLHRFPPGELQEHLKDCPQYVAWVASRMAAGKPLELTVPATSEANLKCQ